MEEAMRTTGRSFVVLLTGLVMASLAGCASAGASATPNPTVAATVTVTAAPTPTQNACDKANLQTLAAGKLTIGTDNPAYPPYFQGSDPKPSGDPWEFGDPSNGQGFESATAYAVAKALGYTQDEVVWTPVPFDNAIQPGPKDFDLYLAQVSYSADRAKAVDLSDGYFDLNQSVVAVKDSPITKVTTVAGLAAFKLGAQATTTSYKYIVDTIKPTAPASAYDTNDLAVAAVGAGQIDGVVVDLPTAFFITGSGELKDSVIVGSLPTAGEVEHFSIVLNLGSTLTPCVNQAIAAIKADGTLATITSQWITGQGAPELK
jgi:polar amino acid transport system substrate-binding protein